MQANHRSRYRSAQLGLEFLEERTVPASLMALNSKNTLLFFDSSKPSLVTNKTVTNLRPGDELMSIDQDPASGLVLALARQKNRYGVSFYLLDTTTGQATLTGSPDMLGVGHPLKTGISYFGNNPDFAEGTYFGVSPDGEFLTYQLTAQGVNTQSLTYVGVAPGDPLQNKPIQLIDGAVSPTSTPGSATIYFLDAAMNTLRRVDLNSSIYDSPQISQVGPLGFDITENAGLDIAADGTAFLAATNPFSDKATLYQLNLTTGQTTALGLIGAGDVIRDVTVLTRSVTTPPLRLKTPGLATTPEDKPLIFSTQAGNAIRLSAQNGSNPILTLSMQLNNSIGTLQLSRRTGLEYLFGDGSPSSQLTVRGTLNNLNAALSGLIFTPNTDLNGDFIGELFIHADYDDQSSYSASASVNLKVTPVNDPPRAMNDQAFVVRQGNAYQPALISVLANDTDLENEAIVISAVTQGKRGGQVKIVFDNNTSYVRYQPPANFAGSDEFTYTVRDSQGGKSTAKVIIGPMTIQMPSLLRTQEDTPLPLSQPGVTPFQILYAGTDDPVVLITMGSTYYNHLGGFELNTTDGLNFIYGSGSRNEQEWRFEAPVSAANLALNSMVFVPFDNLNGNAADAYTFSLDLPTTDPATHAFSKNLSVQVNEVNDPPQAADDYVNLVFQAGNLQTPTILDVLANDSVNPDLNESLTISGWTTPLNGGTVQLQSNSYWPYTPALRYLPPAQWTGSDEFTYTVRDSRGLSATASVKIGALQLNIPDQQTTVEDVPLSLDAAHGNGVSLNYTGTGDPVVILKLGSYLKFGSAHQPLFNFALNAYVGKVSEISAALQSLQFEPPSNYNGSFSVNNDIYIRVGFKTYPDNYFDGNQYGLVSGNLTFQVLPAPDAPKAFDDEAILTRQDSGYYQALVTALLNDYSVDHTPLRVASFTQGTHGAQVQLVPLGGSEGWGFLVTAATLTGADEFTYTLTDAGGLTSTATVSINPFLLTMPVGLSTLEDQPLALGNDSNNRLKVLYAEGSDPNVFVQLNVDYSYTSLFGGNLSVQPTSGVEILFGNLLHGKLSQVNRAFETLVFTPEVNRYGTGTISLSTWLDTSYYYQPPFVRPRFSIDVIPVADPPTANPDAFPVRESVNPVFLNLLSNDQAGEFEPGGFLLTSISDGDQGGQISLNPNGLGVDYQPAPGFRGVERFSYTIRNSAGLESSASVTVTVSGPIVALGAGVGQPAFVKLYDPVSQQELRSFVPFTPSFTGGVHVAIGDVDGDGKPDIVCAQGAGGTGSVQLYHDDGTRFTGWLGGFQPFGSTFTGNIEVALTDFNGDGRMDVVLAAKTVNGVEIKVVQGGDAAGLFSRAIIPNITGSPRIATFAYNDVNNVMVLGPNGTGGFNTVLYNISAGTTEWYSPTLFTGKALSSMVKAHGAVTGYDIISANLVGEWYLDPVITLTYRDGSHQLTGIDTQRQGKTLITMLRRNSTLLPATEVRTAWLNADGNQGGLGNLFMTTVGGANNIPYLDPLRSFQQLTDQTFMQLLTDAGHNRTYQKGVYVAVA